MRGDARAPGALRRSGDAAHHDVRDQHIGLECTGSLHGLLAAVDGTRLKSRVVQDDGHCVCDDFFVIRNEHPLFGLSHRSTDP